MTNSSYTLPEVVSLSAAKMVADDLLRHIHSVPCPTVDARGLREAGVPLLQILVAAKRQADAATKPFAIDAPPDGALAALLAAHGLDPALCGAPQDLLSLHTADTIQRT